jgi:aryl-alcohol dehydrogenase-like predicted oxidoreductase
MEMRNLGRTGLKVSAVCLGTMTWGRQNTEAEGFAQMDYALDQGINFWDTAEMYAVPPTPDTYGKTEAIIGNWFASRGRRDQVVLASKIAGNGTPWIRNGGDITPDAIRTALDGSLARLKTDYIDLYQLHWPNRGSSCFANYWGYSVDSKTTSAVQDNFKAVLETLADCIKQGKIRSIGLSNESSWGVMQYLRLSDQFGLPRIASIQNEYSLLNRKFEPELQEVAQREQVGLLAWSPLAGGMLSGKYANGARPAGSRWSLDARPLFRDTPDAHAAVAAYQDLAAQHGLDVTQMALAFVTSRPFVTANIIGATSMDQLKSNITGAQMVLTQDVLDGIAAIRRRYPIPF